MIGALLGDIVGSVYEFNNISTKDFPLFSKDSRPTDDSIMSLAVAAALMDYEDGGRKGSLGDLAVKWMQDLGRAYPYAGYGGRFRVWLQEERPLPYNSLGNGSAMRVSACGFMATSMKEALQLADAVTEVTHNHPEGMKGAEATVACIFLARQGKSKAAIKNYVEEHYYPLDYTVDNITSDFDETCMGTVPDAIQMFLDSESLEDCIRICMSKGGDCDTTGAIAGAIAEAYYGVPQALYEETLNYLDDTQKTILEAFQARFPVIYSQGAVIKELDPSEIDNFSAVVYPLVVNYYTPIDGEEKAAYMGRMNQSPEAIRRHLTEEGYRYYYAELQGKVVGYIAFYPDGDRMYLSKFYVDEVYRGQGIGRKMFEFVKTEAKKANLRGIFLHVNRQNKTSLEIYERLGMHNAEEVVVDIGGGHYKYDYIYELLF